MTYTILPASKFPVTHGELSERVAAANTDAFSTERLFVRGGSARSGLLEAVAGIQRPVRDVDFVTFGDSLTDEEYKDIDTIINPDERHVNPNAPRFSTIDHLFDEGVDFTINQAVINLSEHSHLTASPLAVEACRRLVIIPTEGQVRTTLKLATQLDVKPFRRLETGIPARAAYFVASHRANSHDFTYDLVDHPRPSSPEDTHTFFLGLMARRALIVDERERGTGDITATQLLIDLYREMGLTKEPVPKSIEDVVKFCQEIHNQHPHLKFYGSEIASKVTDNEAA